MVKTGVFKKIAALTAAAAMLGAFAVSASAIVDVQTTTSYVTVDGEQKVSVIANVSGLSGAVEVTYYASNDDGEVYIDQTTAKDGAATFDYVTAKGNLKSSVLVGYTGNTGDAVSKDVPGYTISGTGIEELVVPTEEINGTHVLAYDLAEGYDVTGVTAQGATATYLGYGEGMLTVTLANATGDVALTVTTEQVEGSEVVAEHIDSAGIISDGTEDEVVEGDPNADVHAKKGEGKVSVLGKLLNVGDDYGVIISTSAVEEGSLDTLPADSYPALGKNAEGLFAVQVIDSEIKADETYHTGLYYKDLATGKYVVIPGETFTIQ